MSEEERRRILEVANTLEYASRPPAQIVADLADKGEWLASESTIYRVLREKGHQHHRGRAKNPVRRPPASHSATAPNQVWTWDITFLKTPVRGIYYYLYMIVDIYSRCIVGWEVHEEEAGECARELITKAYIKQALWRSDSPLILHSDNGSPMKASTFRATLERLGISNSYSRPRTSDDNAYSEALFRTLKYRPEYPAFGFENLEAARVDAPVRAMVQRDSPTQRIEVRHPGQRHRGESAQSLRRGRWYSRRRSGNIRSDGRVARREILMRQK